MSDFEREERYIVVKRRGLSELSEAALRGFIHGLEASTVECVVVESDWPNYEHVWDTIRQVLDGTWQARDQGDVEPVAEVRLNEAGDAASLHWLRPFSSFDVGQKFYSDPPSAKVPDAEAVRLAHKWLSMRETEGGHLHYDDINKIAKALLSATPQPEAGEQWVRCEDRLPTEDDAEDLKKVWICSPIGAVWLCEYSDVRHGIYPVLEGGWYWMPTGLTRPQPPGGEPEKDKSCKYCYGGITDGVGNGCTCPQPPKEQGE